MPNDGEYSLHDVEFLYENYRDLGLKECAETLGRTPKALNRFVTKLRRDSIALGDLRAAARYGHNVQVVHESAESIRRRMKRNVLVVPRLKSEQDFDPIPEWLRITPRDFTIPTYGAK
jgi:hypothetical protein